MKHEMTKEQLAAVKRFFDAPLQQIPIPVNRWDNVWFRLLSDPGVLQQLLPDDVGDIRRVRWTDSEVPCDINQQRLPFALLCVDKAGTLHISFHAETTNWLAYRAFTFGLQYAERATTRSEPECTVFDMCSVTVLDVGGELSTEKLQFSLCHQTLAVHFQWSYDFPIISIPKNFSAYDPGRERFTAQEIYKQLGCTQEDRIFDCELLVRPKCWNVRGL